MSNTPDNNNESNNEMALPTFCYEVMWAEGEDLFGVCYISGFTIADADEKFAREFPECDVVSVSLMGDFI